MALSITAARLIRRRRLAGIRTVNSRTPCPRAGNRSSPASVVARPAHHERAAVRLIQPGRRCSNLCAKFGRKHQLFQCQGRIRADVLGVVANRDEFSRRAAHPATFGKRAIHSGGISRFITCKAPSSARRARQCDSAVAFGVMREAAAHESKSGPALSGRTLKFFEQQSEPAVFLDQSGINDQIKSAWLRPRRQSPRGNLKFIVTPRSHTSTPSHQRASASDELRPARRSASSLLYSARNRKSFDGFSNEPAAACAFHHAQHTAEANRCESAHRLPE